MRAITAIAWRELCQQRVVLLAAAVAALLPLVIPYLPGVAGSHPAGEVRDAVAVVLGGFLTLVLSIGLGSTFVVRDLTENRLGFYFAQPVRGASIWFGKLIAVYLLVIGCELLVLLPGFNLRGPGLAVLRESPFPTLLLVGPLLVILLTHAVSVMVRARSAWVVADLLALVTVACLIWWAIRPLLFIFHLAQLLAGVLAVIALGALITAGAVQVAAGRADLQRSHRALSITLWGILMLGSLGVLACSAWIRSPTPLDLTEVQGVLPAPRGEWLVMTGPSGRFDYPAELLYNTRSGTSLRLRTLSRPVFSADGSLLVTLQPVGDPRRLVSRVVRYDLTGELPRRLESLLTHRLPRADRWACSDDAGRIAFLSAEQLTVYDLDAEQIVMAANLGSELGWVLFRDHDHLRVYQRDGRDRNAGLRIVEVDVPSKSYRVTGQVAGRVGDLEVGTWSLSLDASAGRMLLHSRSKTKPRVPLISVYDAATGEIDETFDTTAMTGMFNAHFLADGRIVASGTVERDQVVLRVLTGDGVLLQEIELENMLPHALIKIGPQPDADSLLVLSWTWPDDTWTETRDKKTFLVDLFAGAAQQIGPGDTTPAVMRREWAVDRAPAAGGLQGRLFLSADHSLLLREQQTGELRSLVTNGEGPRSGWSEKMGAE